jgi:hypothetical protein
MDEGLVEKPVTTVATEPNTGALPPRIQDAIGRLDAAEANLVRIRAMIEQADRDRVEADRDYNAAFATLAEAEANAALDGAVPDDRLRRKAEQHQRALLTHDARLVGLHTRERSAAAEVDAAMSAVSDALDTWSAVRTEEARKAFQDATERFINDVTGPCAVGIALADPRLTFAAKSSQVPALDAAGRNACWQIRAWRENPAMMTVVQECAAIQRGAKTAIAEARRLMRIGEQTDLGGTAA